MGLRVLSVSEVGITIPHPQERASDNEPRLLPSLGPRKTAQSFGCK